jgi:hypothetical protein
VGSLESRLGALEDRLPTPEPDRSEVRERVRANLDRVARLRRSDNPADKAELEAVRTALERQITKRRTGHE